MKRYGVFGYDDYYPGGGMYDFYKSFDTKKEADIYKKKIESSDEATDNVIIHDMQKYN